MTIGIDASRANKQHKTGTEWYSWHLIEELKKLTSPAVIPTDPALAGERRDPLNFNFINARDSSTASGLPDFGRNDKSGRINFVLYTNNKLSDDLGKMPNADWQEKILKWVPRYLWTQIRLWWELFFNPPDVLLVPAHTISLLPISRKIKVIVNVHDVGFKRWPELYKPIQVWYHDLTMRRIKSRADLIITISEFSKKEIIDLYGVKPEKIKVVHLGFDDRTYHRQPQEDIAVVLKKYDLTEPYILYVGRLEKKKNIGNIVKAFALARAEHENLKLVLAGSSGNQYDGIKKIIADLKLDKEIILTGYVDQGDLPRLMAGAKAFVFPTLYEGFGLPILEAMACGTPVITSNQAPHTEVGGEAAIYIDPESPEALADAIIKVAGNDDFRRQVAESGVFWTKEFSWQKTAQEVLGIIKSVK